MGKRGGGYNTWHKGLPRPKLAQGILGVSLFRSGVVNEHVLVVRPLATRSRWRGRRHRLPCLERRIGSARQGEDIKDSRVGASNVVLPPVGVF
jgi:hypothetical protein